MRLERASGGSGEAGLAGWISTNDVTLFTMVLVVLIALALHSSLVKKRKSNEALAMDLSSTAAELDHTIRKHDTLDEELRERRAELAAQGESLEQTEELLQITQREKDQLNEDLTATQELITSLQSSLEGLQTENTNLERHRHRITSQGRHHRGRLGRHPRASHPARRTSCRPHCRVGRNGGSKGN